MESMSNSTSPSLVLFDHTLEDSLLASNEVNASSLFDDAAISDPALTETDTDTSSTFTTYLFFIFPIIGFFVLVMGSCLLRKRQLRQDAEAIRIYRERLSAADAERKLKEERRTRLVEMALITTKVTFLPKRKAAISRRGRSATMETVESELDSTMSSSCSHLVGLRRASEISIGPSLLEEVIDEEKMKDEVAEVEASDAAERGEGQLFNSSAKDVQTLHQITSDSSSYNEAQPKQTSSEYESSKYAPTYDAPSESIDMETCAICLESYRENDEISYSKHQNCSHAFHTDCIKMWLKDEYRNDCPCCRGPYLHLVVREDDGDNYQLGGSERSGTNGDSTVSAEDTESTAEAGSRVTEITHVMDPTSPVAIIASDNTTVAVGDDANV